MKVVNLFKSIIGANTQVGAAASKRRRMRGFSTTDFALWAILAGVAIAILYGTFGGSSDDSEAQGLASDITTVMGNLRRTYVGQYANVTTSGLISGGFFTNAVEATPNGTTSITTQPGGGSLTIAPATTSVLGDSVLFTVTNIPPDVCVSFVSAMSKQATKIVVGSSTAKAPGTAFDPSLITCPNSQNTISVTLS